MIAWRTTFPCRPSRFLLLRVRSPFLELDLCGHPTLDCRVPLRSGRRCARFGHEINARRVRIAPRSKRAPVVCNTGAPKGYNRRALGAKKVSVTLAKRDLGLVTDTPIGYGRARTTPSLPTMAISW